MSDYEDEVKRAIDRMGRAAGIMASTRQSLDESDARVEAKKRQIYANGHAGKSKAYEDLSDSEHKRLEARARRDLDSEGQKAAKRILGA